MVINDNDLPRHFVERWHYLDELSERLQASLLEDDSLDGIDTLAAERHRYMIAFFDDLSAANTQHELRQRLLEHSITVNEKLVRASQEKLDLAANSISTAQRTRRAVAAYHDQK